MQNSTVQKESLQIAQGNERYTFPIKLTIQSQFLFRN